MDKVVNKDQFLRMRKTFPSQFGEVHLEQTRGGNVGWWKQKFIHETIPVAH